MVSRTVAPERQGKCEIATAGTIAYASGFFEGFSFTDGGRPKER